MSRPEEENTPQRLNRRPEDAGQPSAEEIGATSGFTHDQVLDKTLDPEVAEEAKRRRTWVRDQDR